MLIHSRLKSQYDYKGTFVSNNGLILCCHSLIYVWDIFF